MNFAQEVDKVLTELAEMLVEKNLKYGDAALNPKRIFSRANTIEQIKVRMDDKLSRIANAQDNEDEDPEWDLMGYLVILRIARNHGNDR